MIADALAAPAAERPLVRTIRTLHESARMQSELVRHHPILPIGAVVQPAVFLIILLARRQHLSGIDATSAVVAVILTSLWGSTLWTSGGILRREIAEGTLTRCLTSLGDARVVVIGKCVGSTVVNLGMLLLTATAMGLLLRVHVAVRSAGLVVVGLVLVAASGIALGYLLSGVFVVTRHATHVTAALTYPIFIFAGLMIPTTDIPLPWREVSHAVSLYWAKEFIVSAAAGRADLGAVGWTIALTAVYFAAGGVLFNRLIDRARAKGTLDLG